MIKWPYFSFEDSPDIRPLREKVKKNLNLFPSQTNPPRFILALSLHVQSFIYLPPNSFQLEPVPACSLSLSIAPPGNFGHERFKTDAAILHAHTRVARVCVCVCATGFTLVSDTAGTFATAINNKYEQWQTITPLTRD